MALRKANADGAPAPPPVVSLAPGELGFYSRPAVSFIEATYLTLRPSFGDPAAIYAYRTEICWDAGTSSLIFRESERLDANFAQQGLVSVPNDWATSISSPTGRAIPADHHLAPDLRRDVRS